MVLLTACVSMFLVGLSMVTRGGMYILQLMDNHAGTFSALITGENPKFAACTVFFSF